MFEKLKPVIEEIGMEVVNNPDLRDKIGEKALEVVGSTAAGAAVIATAGEIGTAAAAAAVVAGPVIGGLALGGAAVYGAYKLIDWLLD